MWCEDTTKKRMEELEERYEEKENVLRANNEKKLKEMMEEFEKKFEEKEKFQMVANENRFTAAATKKKRSSAVEQTVKGMMVDFKNKLEDYQKIEQAKVDSKVKEDNCKMVNKIFSAVENKMKSFLPLLSRKRANEDSMESGETEPKKLKEAAFETDDRMDKIKTDDRMDKIETDEKIDKMRAEDDDRTEMMMVEGEDIDQIENDEALSQSQDEDGAINQSGDEENLE